MLKFALYVGVAYLVYYLIAIGIEILRAPKNIAAKASTSFSVNGSMEDEESEIIDDIEFSTEGQRAIEKKKS